VKRHEADFVSAIAGLLFVFLGAVMLGGRVEADDFSALWVLPAVLIALGLVVAAAGANRYRSVRASDGDAEEGPQGETGDRAQE
jgi:hypothetical protein